MTIKKGLRQMLEELGTKYSIKMIDFEYCLYRDFGQYDVEISGCNNNKKHKEIKVFVWSKSPMRIVYKSQVLTNLPMLKGELLFIEAEYTGAKI